MRQKQRSNNPVVSAGWLFADMLLVLTMLFLALTPVGKAETTPTCVAVSARGNAATPLCTPARLTPSIPPPTPHPELPCLERQSSQLDLTVDYNGLLTGTKGAITNVQNQVQTPQLRHRRAGLVLLFVGSATNSADDVGFSNQIADKVQIALENLGSRGIIFNGAVYHSPLIILAAPFSTVHIEIYLFALPGHCM